MTELLTVSEVAVRVRVSPKTVERAIHRGDLEASQLALRGAWRIQPEAVDAWIQKTSNRNARPKPAPAPVDMAALPDRRRGRQTQRMGGRLTVDETMGR